MESDNAAPDADAVKWQIRRRICERDFQRGEAAMSRFAAYFVICPTCRGAGKQQRWAHNEGYDVCERWVCEPCDGAGFIAHEVSAQKDE